MRIHLGRPEIEAFDSLGDEARGTALAHLRDCAGCRVLWLAEEPSRVFALLAQATIPADRLERLSARIDAEIRPARRRWLGAASIAASVLLAALVATVSWNHALPVASIAAVGSLEPGDADAMGTRLVALPGDDARVVDLTIGETQVLLIFDESIEL